MSDRVGIVAKSGIFSGLENSKVTNNAQEQEISDRLEFLKIEYNKYKQNRMLYDILQECIDEKSDLSDELKNKVKSIMLSESCGQVMTLDDKLSDNTSTVFGISQLKNVELNYAEKNKLEHIIKLKLDKKYEDIISKLYQTTDTDVRKIANKRGTSPFHVTKDDLAVVEHKKKLVIEQELYAKNLLELQELLEELTKLRIEKVPDVTHQKINECMLQSKINFIKSELAQQKVRVDIFTETTNSLKAYEILIKDIKDQQVDCKKEIENLQELKEKYKQVSCKQYDDILKSYLQYKYNIEKKKLLYDCLKS